MKTEYNLISQEAESSAKQNKVSILVNFGFGCLREKWVYKEKKYIVSISYSISDLQVFS